ncbi:MAG: hypothetical protein K0S41_2483 [Anaerocolumna sp.]|jgi:hypothetical protein|nr:hypothetical protein [Anaerocolumna sp.]
MKNNTLEIFLVTLATPENPKKPAMIDIIKNMIAHFIIKLLLKV